MVLPVSTAQHQLRDEIKKGTCILVLDVNEGVFRVIRSLALEITRADGRIWVQLGKLTHLAAIPKCRLPGCVAARRSVDQALQRLLEGKLSEFAGALTIGSYSFDVELNKSRARQVPTKYSVTTVHAEVPPTFEIGTRMRCISAEFSFSRTRRSKMDVYLKPHDEEFYIYAGLTLEEYDYFTEI